MVEMKTKNFKPFSWQLEAIRIMCKKNKSNFSQEVRKALSRYVEKDFNKLVDEDLLHHHARGIFEKRKMRL